MYFLIMIIFLSIGVTLEQGSPIQQPSCDVAGSDGSYPPVVCKGEEPNGRCFCCGPNPSNAATTYSRIFGWSWSSSAESMTCACSRRRNLLKNERDDVALHCTENGNYDQLQCDNGLCWCVVPTNGQPTERIYPQSMMRYLPCYLKKESQLRQNYWRHCESKVLARIAILRKFESHGTENIHIHMPWCDYDGSYASLRLTGKIINCVWKNEIMIQGYSSNLNAIQQTNCHCARDSIIYEEQKMQFTMFCQDSGNYERSQTSNGRPYCVDSDGFATTTLGTIGADLNCQ